MTGSHEVRGSIPLGSTNKRPTPTSWLFCFVPVRRPSKANARRHDKRRSVPDDARRPAPHPEAMNAEQSSESRLKFGRGRLHGVGRRRVERERRVRVGRSRVGAGW